MASVTVDPTKVHEFADEQSFYTWLAKHHAKGDEVWIELHKVGSGLPSEVDAAKADGRWERAYASGKAMVIPTICRPRSTRCPGRRRCSRP